MSVSELRERQAARAAKRRAEIIAIKEDIHTTVARELTTLTGKQWDIITRDEDGRVNRVRDNENRFAPFYCREGADGKVRVRVNGRKVLFQPSAGNVYRYVEIAQECVHEMEREDSRRAAYSRQTYNTGIAHQISNGYGHGVVVSGTRYSDNPITVSFKQDLTEERARALLELLATNGYISRKGEQA